MYLFSMPEGEALVMSGYDRYYGSIILFCYLYALYYILEWMELQKHLPAIAVTLLLLCVFWKAERILPFSAVPLPDLSGQRWNA